MCDLFVRFPPALDATARPGPCCIEGGAAPSSGRGSAATIQSAYQSRPHRCPHSSRCTVQQFTARATARWSIQRCAASSRWNFIGSRSPSPVGCRTSRRRSGGSLQTETRTTVSRLPLVQPVTARGVWIRPATLRLRETRLYGRHTTDRATVGDCARSGQSPASSSTAARIATRAKLLRRVRRRYEHEVRRLPKVLRLQLGTITSDRADG